MRRARLPMRAQLERRARVIVERGAHAGRELVLELHAGEESARLSK